MLARSGGHEMHTWRLPGGASQSAHHILPKSRQPQSPVLKTVSGSQRALHAWFARTSNAYSSDWSSVVPDRRAGGSLLGKGAPAMQVQGPQGSLWVIKRAKQCTVQPDDVIRCGHISNFVESLKQEPRSFILISQHLPQMHLAVSKMSAFCRVSLRLCCHKLLRP